MEIALIGRQCRALNTAHDALERAGHKLQKHTPSMDRCERAQLLADDRSEALMSLALTLPAQSFADALVQIGQAMILADRLSTNADDRNDIEHKQDVAGVVRVLASIFPLIAQAADVDPADLVDEWCLTQWDHEFGGLAGVMGVGGDDAPGPRAWP